jgi:arginine repressor
MKASTLYDIVIKSQYVCKIDKTKITGFKNRLSNYLKDLGLQKKRYNDGYYYYGIVKKENFFISDKVFKYAKTIQDLKRERQMLIKDMEDKTFF